MTIPFGFMRTWDHKSRVVYVDDRVTREQFANLRFHVYWRDLPHYQRWVDKHG